MKISQLGLIGALTAILAFPVGAQTLQSTPASPSAPSVGTSPKAATPPVGTSAKAPTMAPAPATAPATTKSATSTGLVDINSASSAELDALPGIGKARAAAIIKNRPYKGKDDLSSRHIIPSNVYNGIKDKIIAKQS